MGIEIKLYNYFKIRRRICLGVVGSAVTFWEHGPVIS